jgi:hypothetical protein
MGGKVTMPAYVTGSEAGVEITSPGIVQWEELRIKTIDTGYARPGAFVVYDTDHYHIKVATSGDAGLIGFIRKDPRLSSTTDFTTEDVVQIGHQHGAVVVLPFDVTTGAVTKGAALYVGLHGKVTKAAGTDVTKIAGYAEETGSASGLLRVRLAK